MKIQNRLSIFSSIIFGVVFIVISLLIYGLYSNNKEKSVKTELEKTAYIVAFFYLEEDELNKEEFAKIKDLFTEAVSNTNYQVYDDNGKLIYGSDRNITSINILNGIKENQHLSFTDDKYFNYGIFYEDNQGDFFIIAREDKKVLAEQQTTLLYILLISFIISMIAIMLLSRWMAHIAYRPFRKVIDSVNKIKIDDQMLEIKSPQTEDELDDLVESYNKLLSKISETFIIQKNFVNYVSHEFRTPLASIQGNLEVFGIKDRSPEEYKTLSKNILNQVKQLEDIISTLMIVSDLGKSTDVINTTRIDELIWDIIEKITELNKNARIKINLKINPKEEHLLIINKNKTQMYMALFNLIENAVKYSRGNSVDICLYSHEDILCMKIKDYGIGIPKDQLEEISKPFYRGNNTKDTKGSGIGLSIALRVLEKNNITYKIDSIEGHGTKITITF